MIDNDVVSCVGGGSLLLWLLLQRSSRQPSHIDAMPSVVMHGDLVLPTPESVARWAMLKIDPHEWRRQAVMVGMNGGLSKPENKVRGLSLRGLSLSTILLADPAPHDPLLTTLLSLLSQWLAPIMTNVAAGRFEPLESQMLRQVDFWDRQGKLEWRPSTSSDADEASFSLKGPVMSESSGPLLLHGAESQYLGGVLSRLHPPADF